MLLPGNLDLCLTRGATFPRIVLRCLRALGAPFDLSGWTAQAEVRKKRDDATLVINLNAAVSDGPQGKVSLAEIVDTATVDLPPGRFVWDLMIVDPDGKRWGPAMAGSFTIHRAVSQAA